MNINDFLDDILVEKLLLEHLAQAGVDPPSMHMLDMREDIVNHHISSYASMSSHDVLEALKPLNPLFFGAAWKILDLLFELALKYSQPTRTKVTIAEKVNASISLIQIIKGYLNDVPLLDRLAQIYKNTTELRHALVHRRLNISSSHIIDGKQSISFMEIKWFSMLILAIVKSIESNFKGVAITAIESANMHYLVNQLSNVHKMSVLPNARQATPIPLVRVNAARLGNGWILDTSAIWEKTKRSLPHYGNYFDIEISFPDSTLSSVRGHLDAAPKLSTVEIVPESGDLQWKRN